jgi:benzoylsuccinyl-CoA thiolase BbsB subunit
MAYRAIASGQYDIALAFGVDKLSQFGGGTIPLVNEDWEVSQGISMPMIYAMRATRYLHEYGLTPERLAQVPVKARKHGARNPDAQFQSEVTLEQVISARPVADPFTLLHCCPTGDGGAAALLCAEQMTARLGAQGVRILASELTSGKFRAGFRDMTEPEITLRGAALAYEEAGIGADEINVAEFHDAFSIAELIYCEAFGFCARGEAISLVESGETSLGGRRPVNPSGGLLSKGHPVGATGIAQMVEIVNQLRGRCGSRQVENAKIGLTHATGGGATGFDHGACTIHIFGQ